MSKEMIACLWIGGLQVMNIEALADLRCHNASDREDVRAVHVIVSRTSSGLQLGFRLDGNISRICLTPRSGRQGLVELWRHTCFEAFVAIDCQAAYHEFNFAPSHEWRVYAFRTYRDPAPLMNLLHSPIVAINTMDDRLELDVRIILADLSAIHSHSPLRLGLSAVIESLNGSLSYWALRHPAGKPDFHHTYAFALRLEPPE
jgi:hypothetical protein